MQRNALRSLALALLLIPSVGCELVEAAKDTVEDVTTTSIDVPVETPEFPVVMPSSERIENAPVENNGDRVVELPPAYVPLDIASMDSRLEAGTSVVERINIKRIVYTVAENDLDITLQPIELRIGEPGGDYESALPIATTPAIPPGTNDSADAEIISENQDAVSRRLGDLAFGTGMQTELVIPAGDLPGPGSADVTFRFELEVVINPIGAID